MCLLIEPLLLRWDGQHRRTQKNSRYYEKFHAKVSDAYRVFVCSRCGLLVLGSMARQVFNCSRCKRPADVVQVTVPYATKQMIQELFAMHVVPRLRVKTIKDLWSVEANFIPLIFKQKTIIWSHFEKPVAVAYPIMLPTLPIFSPHFVSSPKINLFLFFFFFVLHRYRSTTPSSGKTLL